MNIGNALDEVNNFPWVRSFVLFILWKKKEHFLANRHSLECIVKGNAMNAGPSKAPIVCKQLSITGDDLVTITVDSDTVVGALKCLKLGKSYGRSLMSDHVWRAPPLLASSLFTALIHHGYIAECRHDSIIQTNPQRSKRSCLNQPIIVKMLWLLSQQIIGTVHFAVFPRCLKSTSDLQFGYKKGFSTDQNTDLLQLGILIMGQRFDVLC